MRSSVRPRGFSLVELLVGAAVGSVVLVGISLAFISQARQYQAHASRRAIQASSRQAMSFLERTLNRAGYGVDPDRAIVPYDAFDSGTNVQSTGFPDAFAVHSRDPLFSRRVSKVETNRLELTAPLTEELYRGQILLVLCPGAITYTYVTVGTPAEAGDSVIQLEHTVPAVDSPLGAPGALFRDEARRLNPTVAACFTGAELPTVVKVDRAAFYVASFDEDGNPATPTTRPYLMLHRGLDLAGGADGKPDGVIDARDAVPLGDGIEQFQVAYILNTIHSSNPALEKTVPPLVGVVDGNIPTTAGGTRPWPFGEQWARTSTADQPAYGDAYDSPRRVTAHPANIRQVRLTLVARSTVPDPQFAGDDALSPGAAWASGTYGGATTWNQLENLGTAPSAKYDPRGGGFYRVVMRQAVTPKNLLTRSQFLPTTPGGG
uniref:Prepilin-type N-terminal cleavage/methylation domain protein n=1 Tax=Aggregicoccus edonensis TaxID=1450165 RepID=A0A3S7UV78_9BACT|nr:prepilin-type N-terminal cleavage/methylation domain protein [Aggregicoccus edonensis]